MNKTLTDKSIMNNDCEMEFIGEWYDPFWADCAREESRKFDERNKSNEEEDWEYWLG